MSNHLHKGPAGAVSSRVSPPLGTDPLQAPVSPPSPPDGPGVQLPPPEIPARSNRTEPMSPAAPEFPPREGIPMTDGTPAGCYQQNAAEFLRGDVSGSVMAQYGQQLFGTQQHTHSRHPAPKEDESGVEELVKWREEAPYG